MTSLKQRLRERALSAIEKREDFIYDIAAENSQIVDNVAHMKWFKVEVAKWLIANVSTFANANEKDVK